MGRVPKVQKPADGAAMIAQHATRLREVEAQQVAAGGGGGGGSSATVATGSITAGSAGWNVTTNIGTNADHALPPMSGSVTRWATMAVEGATVITAYVEAYYDPTAMNSAISYELDQRAFTFGLGVLQIPGIPPGSLPAVTSYSTGRIGSSNGRFQDQPTIVNAVSSSSGTRLVAQIQAPQPGGFGADGIVVVQVDFTWVVPIGSGSPGGGGETPTLLSIIGQSSAQADCDLQDLSNAAFGRIASRVSADYLSTAPPTTVAGAAKAAITLYVTNAAAIARATMSPTFTDGGVVFSRTANLISSYYGSRLQVRGEAYDASGANPPPRALGYVNIYGGGSSIEYVPYADTPSGSRLIEAFLTYDSR